MATNTPPAGSGPDVSPVLVLRSRTPVTPGRGTSPRISSTTALTTNSILGLRRARSSMIFEARNSSRRCTTVTLGANRVRKVASSMAVSPPPTTTSSRPLNRAPSQVAQAETP